MLQAVGGELHLEVLLDTTAPLIPTRHLMPALYNLKMITALFSKRWIIFIIRRGSFRKQKFYTYRCYNAQTQKLFISCVVSGYIWIKASSF
jgi:hypothetical protein